MSLRRDQRGFVLVISVIILVSLTVITTAFVMMLTARTRAAAAELDSAKAFWLAEAGIQEAVYKVMNDLAYRDEPVDMTASLGSGTYTVSAVKQSGKTVYDISSTGTSGSMSRTITQTAKFSLSGWSEAFNSYAAFAKKGVDLRDSTKIYGDAYTLGIVSTTKSSKVTGTVYADTGSGNYTRLPLPDPLLAMPELDTAYYDIFIATAKTYPKGNKTYATLNLAGGTVYVNGTVTATNVTGAGTLVATDTFTLGPGAVGDGVTIISAGQLSFPQNSSIGLDAVLYSSSRIYLGDANVAMNGASLITPGTVEIISSGKNNGVIFSGGDIILGRSVSIGGTVVSGGTITMKQSSSIVQSSSYLPSHVPHGFKTDVSVILSNWQGS